MTPVIRPPVAVVLSRFPRVTETFILREVIELERRGQPVVLAPLIREHPPVVHPEARPWLDRAVFTPFLSPAVVGSNLRALARSPGSYLGLVGRLALGALRSPWVLVKTLVLFPKCVHLAELLAAEGVGHVHAHFATYPATAALVARRLADIPYSLTVHAHDLFVDRTLLGTKLRRARFVRCISEYNRRFLAERYPGAAERLRVVHVGVDPDAYDGGGRERAADASGRDRPIRLLSVAALEPYKGIGVLVEAVDRLRERFRGRRPDVEVRCEVLGEGSERRRLEAELARRGLADGTVSLRLPGAAPQAEVARRMAAADLFVLPSVVAADGQMEGIPVALMEAMASGLPVVASDLSGIPELVEDGVTGVLVPPGDAAALADALEALIEDRAGAGELCRALGSAARWRVVEEFSLRRTVRELLALLDAERQPAGGFREIEGDPLPVEALLPLASAPLAALGVRRVHRRPDGTVWELLVPAGEAGSLGPVEARELVVKRHRNRPGQSAPPRERARREHALLERLRAAGGDGAFGVPRPLSLRCEDGDGVVVMERAAGRPLDALIRRWRLRPDPGSLERAFAAAGAWLRWFQGIVGQDRKHGDLWPGNVWVDFEGDASAERRLPVRVEVIDFEGSGPGTPWDDATYFLRHARRYFRYPGLGRRFARLERAFVEGFQGGAPSDAQAGAAFEPPDRGRRGEAG